MWEMSRFLVYFSRAVVGVVGVVVIVVVVDVVLVLYRVRLSSSSDSYSYSFGEQADVFDRFQWEVVQYK